MIPKIPDLAEAGKIADDLVSTGEERDTELTNRLKLDLTSPFKLPHFIRPISTIYSGAIWGISIIWTLIIASIMISKVGIAEASTTIMSSDSIIMYILAATTANYGTHIGFYMNSRRNEKIQAKNAQATIELKKIEVKENIRQEKAQEKADKKAVRRANRRG